MIKLLPSEERPRERCLLYGPESLSIRECISIILGSGPRGKGCLGLANDILNRISPDEQNGLFSLLHKGAAPLLQDQKGLGSAQRARLLATLELAKRYAHFVLAQLQLGQSHSWLHSSKLDKKIISMISLNLRLASKEWIGFIPAYAPQRLGELCLLEKGSQSQVNFRARDLFSKVLSLSAEGFIIVHNHPSGNLDPSNDDYILTQHLKALAQSLEINMIGHAIVFGELIKWIE